MTAHIASPALSRRVLNRTLLRRQLLTERTPWPAVQVMERLVAMQAQEPNGPYIGLWTRMASFTHDDLATLVHDRQVVRSALLRCTQHLATGDTYRWLRPLLQPVLDRSLRSRYYSEQIAGLEAAELTAIGQALLADQPLDRRTLGRLLAERFPGRKGAILATALELLIPLVHEPRNSDWGGWGSRGGIQVGLAEAHLGRMSTPGTVTQWESEGEGEDARHESTRGESVPGESVRGERTWNVAAIEMLLHRYLAAFGPATIRDLQTWCGLTRLREVIDELRPGLRVFRDETGRELLDLPGAPLAEPDLPAPVRFLPAYDNLLLGHADRSRVISDQDRMEVMPGSAMVRPTFLVDGFVAGTWELAGSTLRVFPFRALPDGDAGAVLDEARRLHPFIAPGVGATPEIVLTGGLVSGSAAGQGPYG